MVRGHAKADAQEKNAKKLQDAKKTGSQKDAQAKGTTMSCPDCKAPFPNYKVFCQHWDSKHKGPCPPDPSA